MAAVDKSILKIANLVAPNSGTVSAAAGSSVAFTSTFAQAAAGTVHVDVAGTATTQFGLVAITGAATLAGTLDVQFASGFTPAAGNTFKVMTYASHTGQFDTVHVAGLASGLVVTPQYNGTDLTLVVSTAPAGMAVVLDQTASTSTKNSTPSITLGLDELFAGTSTTPSFSAASNSIDHFALLAEIPIDDDSDSVTRAANDSSIEYWPTSEFSADKDVSVASDEVFANFGDELLLI